MADDSSPQETPKPPADFFLGQMSERMNGLAREVANILGPRIAGIERRLEALERWRGWLTGAAACFGFVVAVIEIIRVVRHGF